MLSWFYKLFEKDQRLHSECEIWMLKDFFRTAIVRPCSPVPRTQNRTSSSARLSKPSRWWSAAQKKESREPERCCCARLSSLRAHRGACAPSVRLFHGRLSHGQLFPLFFFSTANLSRRSFAFIRPAGPVTSRTLTPVPDDARGSLGSLPRSPLRNLARRPRAKRGGGRGRPRGRDVIAPGRVLLDGMQQPPVFVVEYVSAIATSGADAADRDSTESCGASGGDGMQRKKILLF